MTTTNRSISVTRAFQTSFKQLLKRYRNLKKDLLPTKKALEKGQLPGDQLTGVGQLVYKVRIKNSDSRKGKSGGYRLLYYVQRQDQVVLLEIYSKSDQEDIEDAAIRQIIRHFQSSEH